MKLSAAEAARFCDQPREGIAGALIYGEDPSQVAERRDRLISRLAGPGAAEELRLSIVAATDLRADPGRLDAELRTRGFFPGPRVIVVTGATDGLAPMLAGALDGAASPDAFVLVTADGLGAKSALRSLFEGARNAVSAPGYPDRPPRAAVAERLAAMGAPQPTEDALAMLEQAAADLGPGPFARALEIATLHAGDAVALTAADVAAAWTGPTDAAIDAALDLVIAGRSAALPATLARLHARGAGAVEIALAASRRFRQMLAIAAGDSRQQQAALARSGPPQRRDALQREARRWGPARLEQAIQTLVAADAALRGGSAGPQRALIDRALLRIASMADR
ncbi:MAG: DNA polymerase III subunit delta [Rubrimonas sp.]